MDKLRWTLTACRVASRVFTHLAPGLPHGVAPLALAVAAGCALPAQADFFIHSWDNHHARGGETHLSAFAGYYSTQTNFDLAGALVIPTGLNRYNRIQMDLAASHGLSSRLTAYTNLSWARVELNHDTAAGVTFGPTDQSLGANYRLLGADSDNTLAGLALDLQIQADIPPYNNTSAADQSAPFLGDGTLDLTFGGFITAPISRNAERQLLLVSGTGFTYRSSGFSAALPYSAMLRLQPAHHGFYASLGLAGLYSLQNDVASAGFRLSQGAGGSLIANAINPSLAVLKGEAGYQFNPMLRILVNGSQALVGQSAPYGFLLTFGLRATLGKPSSTNPFLLSPMEYGHSNQGLVEYSLEATVVRANDRLNVIRINKGLEDGVEAGQVFDIFVLKNGVAGEAVARGKVTAVKSDEATLTVQEYFKEVLIDEGFIARRPVE